MKRIFIAAVLILALASSFVAGVLITQASAGGNCQTYCENCTCNKIKCCDGVCRQVGRCQVCPLIGCDV
ncbi:MAG: hypothetical protein A2Z27_00275 [candidate division Zixibacteria bacterium RBG_16_50_21]|nr:MAG: hypothetical protein A2Z27_00275 [candidate division Zixibacteria bacterium RBG_16_50_21]